MTQADVWAAIALLALAVLAAFLVTFARALYPLANAFKVQHQINAHEDEKIASLLDRIRRKEKPETVHPQPQAPTPQRADPLAAIFGTTQLLEPIMDQPDSEGLEVTE